METFAVTAYVRRMITSGQLRSARGLIGWTRKELSDRTGVSVAAIKKYEIGQSGDPRSSTITAIERAFNEAGVIFLDAGDIRDGGPGVRLKRELPS